MELHTVKTLAKELNIKHCTVYKLIKDGMPCIRLGKGYRFDITVVDQWLKTRITRQK